MHWNPIFSNERWLCLVIWEAIISLWVWMSPPSPLGELLLLFFCFSRSEIWNACGGLLDIFQLNIYNQPQLEAFIYDPKANSCSYNYVKSPDSLSGSMSFAFEDLGPLFSCIWEFGREPWLPRAAYDSPTFPIHRPNITMLLILASSWEPWPLGEVVRRLAARMSHFLHTCNWKVIIFAYKNSIINLFF